MDSKDYQGQAMRTAPESRPEMTLTLQQRRLVLTALGLAGEAGEVAEMVKKHVFHGHPFEGEAAVQKLVKELGDVLWYVTYGTRAIDSSLDAVMQTNIDKLSARYPEGFSSERSINREAGDE